MSRGTGREKEKAKAQEKSDKSGNGGTTPGRSRFKPGKKFIQRFHRGFRHESEDDK